ncbi:MAG: pirin-like C-terminal cupin domain-containing protein, partial [Bacteroidota bacterium]
PIVEAGGASIKLIAGNFGETRGPLPAPDSWAADPENEVAIWNIRIRPGASLELPMANPSVKRSLYFYEGSQIEIDGQHITRNFGSVLNPSFKALIKNGDKEAHLLLLQGRPLNEPVARQGPFVMNSQEEIQSAIREYQLTQFGGWPWRYPDNVHAREKGRFAQYPDGTLEQKG